MIPLSQQAAVYRQIPEPSRGPNAKGKQPVYKQIACQIVPVSSFDRVNAFNFESTHIVWVPHWLELRKEDEVRTGRRVDPAGTTTTFTYVVNGRRRFQIGLRHRAYYCRELD